jgi:uncharacterized membrane-anchored protein YitT (DUF2179 family)
MRYVRIFIGNIFITAAYAFITVPKIILNGGVTSFSLVLQHWTQIDIAILVDVLTLALIGLSYVFLGLSYFTGALFSSLCYMGLFNFFHWTGLELPVSDWAGVVLAGFMVAAGYWFCLSSEATAVSFDTIALILHKHDAHFDVAWTMMAINLAVLASGAAAYSLMAVARGLVFTLLQAGFLKLFLRLGGDISPGEEGH